MARSGSQYPLSASAKLALLMPLHFFYERSGQVLPTIHFLAPEALPENERELLVHQHDMTSALRIYHEDPLKLRVVTFEGSESYILRQVVLETTRPPTPQSVEFGAIAIDLASFPSEAHAAIAEGLRPLGGILLEYDIPFISEPQGFFAVDADAFIASLLGVAVGTRLYGRCNVLSSTDGDTMAEIVEILPPATRPVPPTVHPPRLT